MFLTNYPHARYLPQLLVILHGSYYREGYLFWYVLQSERIVLHSACVIPVYKTQPHLLLEVPVGFDVSRFRKLHLHFGKERM